MSKCENKIEKTKVSIIIPVYNVYNYLARCLDSIINQTYRNIEIICINDMSTDRSMEILNQYGEQDSRIRVLENDINRGLAFTRNRGIEEAAGQYVMFIDSDDWIDEDAVGYLADKMESDQLDLLYFNKRQICENEEVRALFGDVTSHRIAEYDVPKSGGALFLELGKNLSHDETSWSCIYSRQFLLQNDIRFINGILHEDVFFYASALLRASRAEVIDRCFYNYFRNMGSITGSSSLVMRYAGLRKTYASLIGLCADLSLDDELTNAVLDYADRCLFEMKKMRVLIGNAASEVYMPLKPDEAIVEHIYTVFDTYDWIRPLSLEELERINKAACIIVYGSGKVGKEVVRFLLNHDKDNIYVGSTVVSEGCERCAGIPVEQIDDLIDKHVDALVLVSVGKRQKPNLIHHLREIGYDNYIEMVD